MQHLPQGFSFESDRCQRNLIAIDLSYGAVIVLFGLKMTRRAGFKTVNVNAKKQQAILAHFCRKSVKYCHLLTFSMSWVLKSGGIYSSIMHLQIYLENVCLLGNAIM